MLAKKETGCGGGDIDAQEVMKITQVTHGEFRLKRSDDGVECVCRVGGKNNIVNIHKEIGNGCILMENVEGRITPGGREAEGEQVLLEPKKPLSWGQFKAVERLAE